MYSTDHANFSFYLKQEEKENNVNFTLFVTGSATDAFSCVAQLHSDNLFYTAPTILGGYKTGEN